MSKYDELIQKWNNDLAEKRLLMRQWANQAIPQYDALPADIRDTLPTLKGRTAEELVPSLFRDDITPEVVASYEQEYAALQAFVQACDAAIDKLNNEEAVRCKLS